MSGPPGFVRVPMAELQEIWAEQSQRKILYNGCTNAALCDRYGRENVRHISGDGWFRLGTAERDPAERFGELA
jgi:hypothetical protein